MGKHDDEFENYWAPKTEKSGSDIGNLGSKLDHDTQPGTDIAQYKRNAKSVPGDEQSCQTVPLEEEVQVRDNWIEEAIVCAEEHKEEIFSLAHNKLVLSGGRGGDVTGIWAECVLRFLGKKGFRVVKTRDSGK